MNKFHLLALLNLKASANGKPRRFSMVAYSGGKLPVQGFPHPVVVDLTGLEIPGSIPILIDHTQSVEATLGLATDVENDGRSLVLAGSVTGISPLAQQVIAQSDAGHEWQASIGTLIVESEDVPAGQSAQVNGQTLTGPFILARKSVLRETSVLPMGADHSTSVNLAARAALSLKGVAAMPTFEDWCKSLGVDAATLGPDDVAAMQLAYESKMATPAPAAAAAAPVVPEVPASAAASAKLDVVAHAAIVELKSEIASLKNRDARRQEIEARVNGDPRIVNAALAANWSPDKAELEYIKSDARRTRPTSFTSAQNAPESVGQVMEAAVCLTRGHKDVASYGDKILQAAHTQFRRGIGLQQILLRAAALNGMHVEAGTKITTGNIREVLQASCGGQMVNAAFSTLNVPGLLSNVANKELLEGYMEEDSAWREIAQIKSVSDFKTVTSYRMLDDMSYEKLGPGGLIKHGSVGEESFTRSVDTYAKMFSLTRTDIINDDLSAFDDLRNRVGGGAAIKLNDLFWTTFLANLATIFTATRTNYIEGSTTNLGTDGVGLGLGVKAFRSRRSPAAAGAKRLGGAPEILLVPPELETIADQLYTARNQTAVKAADVNIHGGKYRPVVANQLSDSAYSGYSTTAWYLLGPKAKGSPVVVSFLNGQETPTVESADADFNTLGIQFRGYHDFGCDLGEYLNAVMSKGAA